MTTNRTLENRVKFDSGLTIGEHGVLLKKGDQEVKMVIKLGRVYSHPRIQIMQNEALITYKLLGDEMVYEGQNRGAGHIEKFKAIIAGPMVSIAAS